MIKFNSPSEFIEELQKDKELVERGIVRLTNLARDTQALPIRHLSVVATYKVKGEIVRLEKFCGQLWGHEPEDSQAYGRAQGAHDTIKSACRAFGLEIRSGVYE